MSNLDYSAKQTPNHSSHKRRLVPTQNYGMLIDNCQVINDVGKARHATRTHITTIKGGRQILTFLFTFRRVLNTPWG